VVEFLTRALALQLVRGRNVAPIAVCGTDVSSYLVGPVFLNVRKALEEYCLWAGRGKP